MVNCIPDKTPPLHAAYIDSITVVASIYWNHVHYSFTKCSTVSFTLKQTQAMLASPINDSSKGITMTAT
jgi:hypothetical protein